MKNRFAIASIGLALVGLTACSDSPMAPSAAPVLTKPSFAIGDTPPVTPVIGQVWVCKVWLGAEGGAPQVTTTANPARSTLTINAANIANLAAGSAGCTLVATSTASTEDTEPGWSEDHIIVTETLDANTSFVSGKVFFSGGQATENFASPTRAQTFNTFHGAVIVFENRYDPPSTGCGYTKGWYQNKNGAPTIVQTLDGRTPDQQRAIFAATPGKPGSVTWQGGNNTLNLYQQLLAALNNVANQNPPVAPPVSVQNAINAALAATGGSGLSITLVGSPDVGALITPLSDFNEGKVAGWPHC